MSMFLLSVLHFGCLYLVSHGAMDDHDTANVSVATIECAHRQEANDVFTNTQTCDCDYYSGGCTISKPAPECLACRCAYHFLWKCSGTIIQCTNTESKFCQRPDYSLPSCRLGGGDCGGYKNKILECDCDYHSGSCYISKPAPWGLACRCEHKSQLSCTGKVVKCSDTESKYCKRPDYSVHSCLLGGGACQGYRTATCECDYHPDGCIISQAPPRYTACKCIYKGHYTCEGEITLCSAKDSRYCRTPDKSIQSCLQGHGDCAGYKSNTGCLCCSAVYILCITVSLLMTCV